MERNLIAFSALGFALLVAAGWALAMALRDSNDEIQVDFETLKERERK